MPDLPVWTLDALLRLGHHADEAVREWAIARLGRAQAPAAHEALFRALDDPAPGVLEKALRAILAQGFRIDTRPHRDALQRVALRGAPFPAALARLAEQVLLRDGDEEATARLVETCFRDEPEMGALWFVLVEHAPGQVLQHATGLGLLTTPRIAPIGALLMMPRVAPREALANLYAKVPQLDDKGWGDVLLHEMLLRAGAEHVFEPGGDELADLTRWLVGRSQLGATEASRELVLRWLSPEAFEVPLKALRARQWGAAIAWSAAWCEKLEDDDDRDDDAVQWSRTLLKLMGADRAARARHAYSAVSLAVAASERTLERSMPFTTCAPDEQLLRTAFSAESGCYARQAAMMMRWHTPQRREAEAAAMASALSAIGGAPEIVQAQLLRIAGRLKVMLPASVLDLAAAAPAANAPALRAYFEAHADGLQALAPVSLDATTGKCQPEVLQALACLNATWVTQLLKPRLAALSRTDDVEHLLPALESLGDVSLLPDLLALWKPGAPRVAHTALHLARLDDRSDTLPPELLAEAQREQLRRAQALTNPHPPGLDPINPSAISIELRCNRCHHRGRHALAVAFLHPDPQCYRREGWDGVTFTRIVVCRRCGAEDDYTLGTIALMSIATASLHQKTQKAPVDTEGGESTTIKFAHARLADGTAFRRASDALRHWRQKTERNPRDGDAWLRLGLVLKANDRVDEAVVAFRQAMALQPKGFEAPSAMLSMLLDHGRVKEAAALPPAVLEALPNSTAPQRARSAAAQRVILLLRTAAETGLGLALRASWKGAGNAVMRGSVALQRVTRWDRMLTFLMHTGLVKVEIVTDSGDAHEPDLEALLEGDEPIGAPPPPKAATTVVATPRPGRNDPCHCGSGKKYKKCHGT